jgi:hypothetical protein
VLSGAGVPNQLVWVVVVVVVVGIVVAVNRPGTYIHGGLGTCRTYVCV